MTRLVRIGNGQGFWGDTGRGPAQLVSGGGIDYLTMDFLAEVTMSIMQKSRARDDRAGYATDFVRQLRRILPDCAEHGVKVIANAGGVNPSACAEAVTDLIHELGLDLRVASVGGDDILERLPELVEQGHPFTNLDSGHPLEPVLERVRSANVYLGAFPIAEALDSGADIVVTGRVADAALALAPMIHEFAWETLDHDKLSAGIIAGHIIECGTQCTGGNYDRWREVPDMAGIGFPVVEVEESGAFVVTKKEGTGGLVDIGTVTAQLLYEVGDPRNYLTPDVVADFTSVRLEQVGKDRVRATGITGRPPTNTYKVSISTAAGWRTTGQLTVGGPAAVEKARFTADIMFARLAEEGVSFPDEDRLVEIVGNNVLYPGMISPGAEPSEVVLRISVRAADRDAVNRFGDEFASLLTSGPPGLTGFAGGRPKASEIVGFWPALIDKGLVDARIELLEATA